ncbi:hypothetical protein [Curtobacterium sp. PhB136]|uniref:hypothetical protein n=1 Tax=Curtobacterium sp. PhB136 TaxID=2485181 RepID=UPI0010465862|nr:hypothetical protein [Curtobacterium sp. PhB136]TCK63682.1 hypothetical protein EDF27_2228 [Curtobacterium sp. PhB136]
MRVNVVRITIATVAALCLGLFPVATAPAVAAAAVSPIHVVSSVASIAAPNGPGLRRPHPCAVTSPGGVPASLYAEDATLSAGYWFEECRVGASVHLRNLTPSVWTIDLLRSGALDPRPTRSAVVARFELFHSQYPPATLLDETIAPGETLVFRDVDQFVLTHDLRATAAWLTTRATSKWLRDVAEIDLPKERMIAAAERSGTVGAALAACYSAVETVSGQWEYLSSDDVVTRSTAVLYAGMKTKSCVGALRTAAADSTVVRAAESDGDSLLRTVTLSVGETASVSALERFGPLLRTALAAR